MSFFLLYYCLLLHLLLKRRYLRIACLQLVCHVVYYILDGFHDMPDGFGDAREHVISELSEEWIRLLVGTVIVMYLSIMIDYEYAAEAYADGSVAHGVRVAIAETAVERAALVREKIADVLQSSDLEHLRLPVDDLAFEGADQTVRGQDHRAVRHHKDVVLLDTLDVVSC